jgi:uncharacterized membrane protein YfcA
VLQWSAWLLLPTFLGFFIGTKFADRIGQKMFNRVVGLLLILPGLNLLL